ncbi:MAG: hypothetical protein EBQ96_02700 [Proteobacteria bacterium]|nr:hypothetical protein [Pseudomonadota bacterium]
MGSLFTKPKLPDPVSYAYVPPAQSAPAPISTPPAGSEADPDVDRAKTLVQKKRSLPQTIETSFRGVLAQADFVPARKSLLGE